MERRRTMGVMIYVLSITAFFVYAYLLMLSEWSPIILQLTLLMMVGGILGIISWIGYTMVTTKPSPSSITDE